MGRKERRENIKKYGYKEENVDKINEKSLKRFIKITVVILFILVLLYFVMAIFITKEIDLKTGNKKSDNTATTTSSSNSVTGTILAKNTFRQTQEVYYVYYYDYKNTINDIDSGLSNLDDKVYKVNTSDALNTNYVADTGNRNVSSIDDLKVISPTLIKIEGRDVTAYYEGKEEIIDYLY